MTYVPSLFGIPLTEKGCPAGSRLVIKNKMTGREHTIEITGYEPNDHGLRFSFMRFTVPGCKLGTVNGPYVWPVSNFEIVGLCDQYGHMVYNQRAICQFDSVQRDYLARQAA